MRDSSYLEYRLGLLWQNHFAEIPRNNKVEIRFGRKARRRLGSIRKYHFGGNEHFDTLIYINGYFKDLYIPEFVIDATICHELAHYAHGFSSPLPQLSRFPHRGGLVDQELSKRGLDQLVQAESAWLQHNWLDYLSQHQTIKRNP